MENDEYNFVDMWNEMEDPRLGFTTGLVAHYQFSNRFALESGIQFSDKGDKMEMNIEWKIPGENFTIDPAIPVKSKSIYHYYYLGVPIKLNYYFLQSKIKMYASIGVVSDFFVDGKNRLILEYKDRTEKQSNDIDADFNKVNFVGLANLGMETDISSRLTFRFEPTFRYSFTPIFDAPMKRYLYSFGANVVLFQSALSAYQTRR